MLILREKKNEDYGILDTKKRVVMFYSKPDLLKLIFLYKAPIENVDKLQLELINQVKHKGVIIENTDTRNTAIKKLNEYNNKAIAVLNMSDLSSMKALFSKMTLQSLDLTYFNTSHVTNMTGMFDGVSIPILDLSSFNTKSVTNMTYMFAGSKIKSLNLSSFNTKSVQTMAGMFKDCNIDSLDLSSFDTLNVNNFSKMFKNAKIRELNIRNFTTDNATLLDEMFLDCKIESVVLSKTESKILSMLPSRTSVNCPEN